MYCPYFNYLQDMYRQYSPPEGPPPFGGGGQPPFGGGTQGPGGPGGQGGQGGPSGPPPSFTPSKSSPQLKAVDPGAVRPCRYRFIYIWLDNGRSFWAWLTYVGRTSVAGWRWNGRRWVYFGIDTRRIESFVCY